MKYFCTRLKSLKSKHWILILLGMWDFSCSVSAVISLPATFLQSVPETMIVYILAFGAVLIGEDGLNVISSSELLQMMTVVFSFGIGVFKNFFMVVLGRSRCWAIFELSYVS